MNEKKEKIFMEFKHGVEKWLQKNIFVIIDMLNGKNISSRGGCSERKHLVPDPLVLFLKQNWLSFIFQT